jgi:hypothetical protein
MKMGDVMENRSMIRSLLLLAFSLVIVAGMTLPAYSAGIPRMGGVGGFSPGRGMSPGFVGAPVKMPSSGQNFNPASGLNPIQTFKTPSQPVVNPSQINMPADAGFGVSGGNPVGTPGNPGQTSTMPPSGGMNPGSNLIPGGQIKMPGTQDMSNPSGTPGGTPPSTGTPSQGSITNDKPSPIRGDKPSPIHSGDNSGGSPGGGSGGTPGGGTPGGGSDGGVPGGGAPGGGTPGGGTPGGGTPGGGAPGGGSDSGSVPGGGMPGGGSFDGGASGGGSAGGGAPTGGSDGSGVPGGSSSDSVGSGGVGTAESAAGTGVPQNIITKIHTNLQRLTINYPGSGGSQVHSQISDADIGTITATSYQNNPAWEVYIKPGFRVIYDQPADNILSQEQLFT